MASHDDVWRKFESPARVDVSRWSQNICSVLRWITKADNNISDMIRVDWNGRRPYSLLHSVENLCAFVLCLSKVRIFNPLTSLYWSKCLIDTSEGGDKSTVIGVKSQVLMAVSQVKIICGTVIFLSDTSNLFCPWLCLQLLTVSSPHNTGGCYHQKNSFYSLIKSINVAFRVLIWLM